MNRFTSSVICQVFHYSDEKLIITCPNFTSKNIIIKETFVCVCACVCTRVRVYCSAGIRTKVSGMLGKDSITELNPSSKKNLESSQKEIEYYLQGNTNLDDNRFLIWSHEGLKVEAMKFSSVERKLLNAYFLIWWK